jgi:multidrug transporter EmrE-like cation transporter
MCGIFAKLAAKESFLTMKFMLFYGTSLFILVVYSFLWQIILRRIPLNTAYSNKGVVIVWGMIWGGLFFGEEMNIAKIIAVVLIIIGVVFIGRSN